MNSIDIHVRGRAVAISIGIAALLLLASASTSHAGKIVDRVVVGTQAEGTGEGQFASANTTGPAGLAFNDPGIADNTTDPQGDSTDGYLYVADPGNHRIQVFDAAGDFKFTFGRGVLTGGDGGQVCDHTQSPCKPGTLDAESPLSVEEGELVVPRAIAINQQTGDLYVYGGNGFGGGEMRRIDQFAADGTFVRAWGWGVATGASAFEKCTSGCRTGSTGPSGGQFQNIGRSGDIAVDPSAPHHVFLVDEGNNRVQEFEADGDFVRLWGRDVVNTGQPGNVGTEAFEVCSSTAVGVCKAGVGSLLGNGDDKLGALGPVAVDSSGVVYVGGSGGVYRFDSSTATPAALLKPRISSGVLLDNLSQGGALAIDPDSGNLLVAYEAPKLTAMVSELNTSVEPPVVVGVHLENFAVPPGIPPAGLRTNALTVDPASGDFYFSGFLNRPDDFNHLGHTRLGHRVFAADDDGAAPAPTLAIDDPSSTVNGPNVTFSGEVTPNGPPGIPTTYNFSYRKVGSGEAGWITVTPSDNPVGEGNTPVTVSDDVSDLQPNTDYEVRLVARKAFGNPQVQTAPLTFTSDAIPPEAETIFPQARSTTSATLAARINPNNTATTYFFEWGETASYGNVTPVADAGDDFGDRLVTTKIAGLDPDTTYHYRVVADNGVEVSPGDTEVEGDDVSFGTRAAVTTVGERGIELVTPPFKVTRQTGHPSGIAGDNPKPAIASLDGDTVHWDVDTLPLTDDVAAPLAGDRRIIRRTASGWVNSTRNTLPLLGGNDPFDGSFSSSYLTKHDPTASSGDFETITWRIRDNLPTNAFFLPSEGKYANRTYTRRDGTGTKGFTAWLTNPEAQIADQGFSAITAGAGSNFINDGGHDMALLNDAGSAMARWGHYRGLAENPDTAFNEDPSDDQQLEGSRGGASAYIQRAADPDDLPSSPKELVNACAGTIGGGDATLIPARVGSGAATDTIGTQTCVRGKVTNVRGAAVGDRGGVRDPAGRAATALSDDGNRVFFQSPDRFATTTATGTTIDPSVASCSTGTGVNTACPPQLFVRQDDSEGEPFVRWISSSRSVANGDGSYGGAMIAGQRVAEMGAGVRFEGASRDGGVVYFRTNAPLTPDDPNGGKSITTESAQESSWDLYRYELPESLQDDPSGGALMRVTGGPAGTADPGATGTGRSNIDASIRFHSDDGSRAYFLTTAKIDGADEAPPKGGSTAPGGAVANTASRNLYLFDAGESGTDRWKFIARIPYETDYSLDTCAGANAEMGEHLVGAGFNGTTGLNCFRGTPSGNAVLFATTGQLSGDDLDSAADLYLYDAAQEELVRITAPPAGQSPYVCLTSSSPGGPCNGELGRNSGMGFFSEPIDSWETARGWGGMRYYNLSTDSNGVVSAYFATELALVDEDTNDAMDVYEWRAGELSMISPPGTPEPSWFSGNSLDGEDVFFTTGARIDPREVDDADLDVYDARLGGGFPYTPPPTPCDVLTFGCESEAIAAPPARGAATVGASGSGNFKAAPKPRCPKGKTRRGKRCVKRNTARKCRKASGKAKQRCTKRANAERRAGR